MKIMSWNERLRQERIQRNWRQEDVAEKLGTTPLTVSRWERASHQPSAYFRAKLCTLFGKSAQELGLWQGFDEKGDDHQGITHYEENGASTQARLYDPAIPSPFEEIPSLVGRDAECSLLKRYILGLPGSLAIYGLPGVGKTALAVALAHDDEIRARFDGILWVGLGPEPNTRRLLSRWGLLLGLAPSEMAQFTSIDLLGAALRDAIGTRRMLLIIDDAWDIKAASDFKIGGTHCVHLVTTRFPPIAQQFSRERATLLHELGEEDSLTLLQRLAPLVVTDEPREARELAQSVGGLPLALTLMGKYLQIQAHDRQPRRIRRALERLHHIDTRLRLTEVQGLSVRNPSLPAGTSLSLRAAIEVSDQQLDQQAQEGLRALSIFPAKPNSFSESAALTICGLSEEALDMLTDAGLLESYSSGRYTLHQTIADYAKLHRTNTCIEENMVHFFVSFLETHQYDYEQVEPEFNNILAAFEIAESRGMFTALQQGVLLFAPFLEARGLYTLAERYLNQVKQATFSSEKKENLALIWFHLGRIAYLRGNMLLAEERYHEGLAVARKTTCSATLSLLLAYTGEVMMRRGDLFRAEQYLLEGLERASELKLEQCMGVIFSNLGEIATYRGDAARGNELYQQGLELARWCEDWATAGTVLQNLGVNAEWRGDYAQASAYYREGMACAQRIRDRPRMSAIVMNLGMLAFRQQQYREAEQHYMEALELARKTENRYRESAILQNLGMLERARNNYPQARAYLMESLNMAREIGHDWLASETLTELGELALQQQHMEEATTIFGEVFAKLEPMGDQVDRELLAAALYGLARVDAHNQNYAEAYAKGRMSQAIYEKKEHVRAKQIAEWLLTLPRGNPAA